MKKLITLLAILILAMIMCACGKEEVEFSATPVSTQAPTENNPYYMGIWKLDAEKNAQTDIRGLFGSSVSDYGAQMKINEDGTFSVAIGSGYGGEGSYVAEDNKLTAKFNDYNEGNSYSLIIEYTTINGKEYLKTSIYNTTLYWSKDGGTQQSTVTPNAAVTPAATVPVTVTPIPSSAPTSNPASTGTRNVVITKNPTGETVTEGGNATFIAKADNYTNVVWVIVSPDAKTIYYSANDAVKDFKDLKVSGQGTEKLVLSNIPLGMNGYRVQCYFEGNGGPLYTSGAYITVNKAGSSVTPTQLALDYSEVVKKYADYSHWSMSGIENFRNENGYDEFQLTLTRGAVKLICVLRTYPTENTCYPESITWYESDELKGVFPFGKSDSESWNHFEKTILDITDMYGDGTAGQSMQ